MNLAERPTAMPLPLLRLTERAGGRVLLILLIRPHLPIRPFLPIWPYLLIRPHLLIWGLER